LLDSVAPTDVAGRVRHQLATELLGEIVVLDKKMKDSDKTLRKSAAATGTGLLGSPPARDLRRGTAPHPWMPPAAYAEFGIGRFMGTCSLCRRAVGDALAEALHVLRGSA